MTDIRPPSTAAQQRFGEILEKAQDAMLQKVLAAVREAHEQVQGSVEAAELGEPSPSYEFFAAGILQKMYCILCHADLETFAGGDAKVAIAVIRNCQNIAKHYWGADIEPYPMPL